MGDPMEMPGAWKLECKGGVVDNSLERELGEPISTSSQLRYIDLHTDTFGKRMNPHLPLSYGLISKTCTYKSLTSRSC